MLSAPREHKAAALEGQGRSFVPPAYQNVAAAHLMIQSSAVPCKPGAGILALVLAKVSLYQGSPESSGAQAQGESSALGSRQGQGSTRQLCRGAQEKQSQPEPQPPSQGLS